MTKDEALSFLKDFIHKIDTQPNACTAKPILIELRAIRRHFTEHTGGWNGGWWRDDTDCECKPVEASSEKEAAKKLSEYYGEPVNEDNLMELDLFEYEEVLQTFLTHEAYDEHIRLNGHNLPKEYFKYVRHATRDPELVKMFEAIREITR